MTQLLAALMTTDALDGVKESAKALADRIRGMNIKTNNAPTPTETPAATDDERSHSTSQQSYNKKLSNLTQFLQIIDNESAFRSNVKALSKTYWDAKQAELAEANTNVNNVFSSLRTARSVRDRLLYAEKTGLVDLAVSGVKKELKAAFGQASNEYKQVSGLKFTKISL